MRRPSLRLAAGALMVAGLSLVAAPLAAAAHTGNLYTWAYPVESRGAGFAIASQTDASLTALTMDNDLNVNGADICNDEGWAVTSDNEVASWNHDTGVPGTPIALSADTADFVADFPDVESVTIENVFAADSLADCSKIAYIDYFVDEGDSDTEGIWVAYIDAGTGETTPIAQLPEISGDGSILWQGIATDPVTGSTYLFAQWQGGVYFSILDLGTGAASSLAAMDGLMDSFESGGRPYEADFQPDGKLWLIWQVNQLEAYDLVSFAPNSDLSLAEPTDVGDPNAGNPPIEYSGDNVLTYDPKALPATGGGVPVGLLLVGGTLFAAGLALVAVRRIRTAR